MAAEVAAEPRHHTHTSPGNCVTRMYLCRRTPRVGCAERAWVHWHRVSPQPAERASAQAPEGQQSHDRLCGASPDAQRAASRRLTQGSCCRWPARWRRPAWLSSAGRLAPTCPAARCPPGPPRLHSPARLRCQLRQRPACRRSQAMGSQIAGARQSREQSGAHPGVTAAAQRRGSSRCSAQSRSCRRQGTPQGRPAACSAAARLGSPLSLATRGGGGQSRRTHIEQVARLRHARRGEQGQPLGGEAHGLAGVCLRRARQLSPARRPGLHTPKPTCSRPEVLGSSSASSGAELLSRSSGAVCRSLLAARCQGADVPRARGATGRAGRAARRSQASRAGRPSWSCCIMCAAWPMPAWRSQRPDTRVPRRAGHQRGSPYGCGLSPVMGLAGGLPRAGFRAPLSPCPSRRRRSRPRAHASSRGEEDDLVGRAFRALFGSKARDDTKPFGLQRLAADSTGGWPVGSRSPRPCWGDGRAWSRAQGPVRDRRRRAASGTGGRGHRRGRSRAAGAERYRAGARAAQVQWQCCPRPSALRTHSTAPRPRPPAGWPMTPSEMGGARRPSMPVWMTRAPLWCSQSPSRAAAWAATTPSAGKVSWLTVGCPGRQGDRALSGLPQGGLGQRPGHQVTAAPLPP